MAAEECGFFFSDVVLREIIDADVEYCPDRYVRTTIRVFCDVRAMICLFIQLFFNLFILKLFSRNALL